MRLTCGAAPTTGGSKGTEPRPAWGGGEGAPGRGPREERRAMVSRVLAAAGVPWAPPRRWALMVLPSANERNADGMVTAGPGGAVPPISVRLGSPTALLAMMAPMAPA